MAVLLKCGGLFLHIPRTGGRWITEVLESSDLVFAHVGERHATAADLAPLERLLQTPHGYGKGNRPLLKFCFVRHPQRWYEASYRAEGAGSSFDAFVEKAVRERPGYLSALYESYTQDAHFVGRFERLAEDLEIALTLLRAEHPQDVGRATAPHRAGATGTPPEGSPGEPDKVRPTGVNADTSVNPELHLDFNLQQALEESERDAYLRYGYAGSEEKPESAPLTPFSPSVLLKGPFVREKGFAWKLPVEELARFADTDECPRRSMVSLLENGMPLRMPHVSHDDIRNIGGGRFSHWNDTILFSTSDNTDPNESGRRYDLAWVFPAAAGSTGLMLRPRVEAAAAQAA